MNLIDVPRNDIAAARRYHDEHKPITPDEVRTLLMLQDDPSELKDIIKREEWDVRRREEDDDE